MLSSNKVTPEMDAQSRKSTRKTLKKVDWTSPWYRTKFIISQTWKFFFTILIPILYLPIFLWKPEEKNAKAPFGAYLIFVMASYWVSECLPLALTSLLPVFLLPLFGMTSSDAICSVYFNNTIIFLFGGCVIALSFEYSNLHTRISFFVMKFMGAQPSILLLGMMMTCMVLSCWMNNTSTTAMMVPCISVIMEQYTKKMIPDETATELGLKYGIPDESTKVCTNCPPVPPGPDNDPRVDELGHETLEDHQTPKQSDLHMASSPGQEGKRKSVNFPEEQALVIEAPPEPPREFQREVNDRASVGTTASAYWEDILEKKQKYLNGLRVMFLLGVAFASNIGGTGVITGTATNLIAISQLRTSRNDIRNEIKEKGNKILIKRPYECVNSIELWELDFARWFILNVFPMILNTILCWVFLSLYYQGPPQCVQTFWTEKIRKKRVSLHKIQLLEEQKEVETSIKTAIKAKYSQLGSTTLHEKLIMLLFVFLVIFWIFKNPLFARGEPVPYEAGSDKLSNETIKLVHPRCLDKGAKLKLQSSWGWSRFFGDKCDEAFIHDTVSTVFICFVIFVLPKDPVYYKNWLKGGLGEGLDDPLLPFRYVAQHIPWGPLFMLGGGFGISKAITASHLNAVLSDALRKSETLKQMDISVLLAVLLFGVSIITTVASNTATASIISPVLINLAQAKGYPPLFMLLPPIVGASYAFCLPISTPPNAIVYDKGNMKQTDMIKPGFWVTIICNIVLYVVTLFLTKAMLNVDGYNGACDIGQMITPMAEMAGRLGMGGGNLTLDMAFGLEEHIEYPMEIQWDDV